MNVTTATDLKRLLRAKYAAPSYAFFEEVRNRTGFAGGGARERYVDALAMGLWPSTGMGVIGFEVKVTRGDWKRELADPAKADAFSRYCDHWYVVAPMGIIPPDDVPSQWGLLEAGPKGLITTTKAANLKPIPPDRAFVASLIRQVDKTIDAAASARARELEAARVNNEKTSADIVLERLKAELQKLRGNHEELCNALGMSSTTFDWRKDSTIAQIRQSIARNHDFEELRTKTRHLGRTLEDLGKMAADVKALEALLK